MTPKNGATATVIHAMPWLTSNIPNSNTPRTNDSANTINAPRLKSDFPIAPSGERIRSLKLVRDMPFCPRPAASVLVRIGRHEGRTFAKFLEPAFQLRTAAAPVPVGIAEIKIAEGAAERE